MLVTGGGRQSNHVRMTAAAANHLGLDCTIVLGSDPVDVATGNVVLDQLLGPEIVWAGPLEYYALEAAIEDDRRPAARRRPPARTPCRWAGRPRSGSSGYVRAASELRDQLPDTTLIATADGTGGTHAGLVAGWGDHAAVLGVDVGTRPDLDDVVPREAAAAAALADRPAPSGHVRDRPRPHRRRLRRPDPRAAARRSTCAPASRACSSIPCTPARAWPG